MDKGKKSSLLSIPQFCKVIEKAGVRKQIIDIAKREYCTDNNFNEEAVQGLLDKILSKNSKIEKSCEFKYIKEFRNHRAAHSTFKNYEMSISHLITVYYDLVKIGGYFQTVFGSAVCRDDYWELEFMYRQAAATMWQLKTPIEPILFKGTLIINYH